MSMSDVLVQGDGRVPKARYISAEFARLELDRLWSRVWQIACREEELAEPGEFDQYEIGDQSLLVVRGRVGASSASRHAICQTRFHSRSSSRRANSAEM